MYFIVSHNKGLIGLILTMAATQIVGISYGVLFGICAVFSILGFILLRFWVKEPRWQACSSMTYSKNAEKEK